MSVVGAAILPLPDDVGALKALLAATIQRADDAEARLATAAARESATQAMIAHLKLQIAKLRREQYGPSAERSARLLEQMELQLEDLEADAGEDDLAAEAATARATSVAAFERKRPVRKPFPAHLPRERVVIAAPCSCPACGGSRLSKLGEDVTETLEVIPRSWKVIQTVREKVSCRDCETITPTAGTVPRRAARLGRPELPRDAACSRSTGSTSRSTGRPTGSRARACRSASPRSPTKSARPRSH